MARPSPTRCSSAPRRPESGRRVSAAPSAQAGPEELIEAEQDLDADEADDVPFEPDAALVLHEVDEGAHGLVDEGELALHGPAALDQLVLVLEPRIKALELGVIPQHVRLFLDLDAADHAVLRQQHVADLTQELARLRAGPSAALQFRGKRLDAIEYAGDLGLVIGQHQAFRQHVGDDLQALGRGVLEGDAARGIDLVLAVRLDRDLYGIG